MNFFTNPPPPLHSMTPKKNIVLIHLFSAFFSFLSLVFQSLGLALFAGLYEYYMIRGVQVF